MTSLDFQVKDNSWTVMTHPIKLWRIYKMRFWCNENDFCKVKSEELILLAEEKVAVGDTRKKRRYLWSRVGPPLHFGITMKPHNNKYFPKGNTRMVPWSPVAVTTSPNTIPPKSSKFACMVYHELSMNVKDKWRTMINSAF